MWFSDVRRSIQNTSQTVHLLRFLNLRFVNNYFARAKFWRLTDDYCI